MTTTVTKGSLYAAFGAIRQRRVQIPIETSVAFTGHRPQRLGGFDERSETARWVDGKLRSVILSAVDHGKTHFIVGGALGVDTWAAEIVLGMRPGNQSMKLIMAVPFQGQDRAWPDRSRDRYRMILSQTDHVKVVSGEDRSSPNWLREAMNERNRWMVDHSSVLVAVWDGVESGGTYACITYARELGRRILWINPVNRTLSWLGMDSPAQ